MPSSSTPEVGDIIVDVELLLCVCFVILLRNFNMEKFLIKRPRFQNKTEATVYIIQYCIDCHCSIPCSSPL